MDVPVFVDQILQIVLLTLELVQHLAHKHVLEQHMELVMQLTQE
jgi:hypothetical protein